MSRGELSGDWCERQLESRFRHDVFGIYIFDF